MKQKSASQLRINSRRDFWWGSDDTYHTARVHIPSGGDSPLNFLVDLGSKPLAEATTETQEYIASWRCSCSHDCCAHRFAMGGRAFQRFGKTFAHIRTEINV